MYADRWHPQSAHLLHTQINNHLDSIVQQANLIDIMTFSIQYIMLTAATLAVLTESKPLSPYRLEGRSLQKRAVTEIICGMYPTADISDNGKNLGNLRDKGGSVAVGAHSCSRIACYNTRYAALLMVPRMPVRVY